MVQMVLNLQIANFYSRGSSSHTIHTVEPLQSGALDSLCCARTFTAMHIALLDSIVVASYFAAQLTFLTVCERSRSTKFCSFTDSSLDVSLDEVPDSRVLFIHTPEAARNYC